MCPEPRRERRGARLIGGGAWRERLTQIAPLHPFLVPLERGQAVAPHEAHGLAADEPDNHDIHARIGRGGHGVPPIRDRQCAPERIVAGLDLADGRLGRLA